MAKAVLTLTIIGSFIFFFSGFYCGRLTGKQAAIKEALMATTLRDKINHESNTLDGVDLCLALGGVREQCVAELRRMEQSTESTKSNSIGYQ